jgi:hypothetical protein
VPTTRATPERTARQLARAVGDGRQVAAALRHLHTKGDEPDADLVARELAFFLVARCEARHAGWRVLRQVVVDAGAEAPWEKCARRAVPAVADELMLLSRTAGRTPLAGAQHIAARERAAAISPYVASAPVLKDLGLPAQAPSDEAWRDALVAAVGARSREQVAREIAGVLHPADPEAPDPDVPGDA